MANGIIPLLTKLIKIPRAIAIPNAVKAEKLVMTPSAVSDRPPRPINTDLRLPYFCAKYPAGKAAMATVIKMVPMTKATLRSGIVFRSFGKENMRRRKPKVTPTPAIKISDSVLRDSF